MRKLILALSVVFTISSNVNIQAQLSGPILPSSCVIGQTFIYNSTNPPILLLCNSTNSWTVLPFYSAQYTLPDNVSTHILKVSLPTPNTGCSVQIAFSYSMTDGLTKAVSHTGIVSAAFVNENGVVSGKTADAVDVAIGSGCTATCDDWTTVLDSPTTIMLHAKFDNSLSMPGKLRLTLLAVSCESIIMTP
jgi:hypothetical protein